jgi:hypothetical protein
MAVHSKRMRADDEIFSESGVQLGKSISELSARHRRPTEARLS